MYYYFNLKITCKEFSIWSSVLITLKILKWNDTIDSGSSISKSKKSVNFPKGYPG